MVNCRIEGVAYYGPVTKQLLHEIPPFAIIIIDHEDLDMIAAEEIVRKKVRAVINMKKTMTGKLPRAGMEYLINNAIPVFDMNNKLTFSKKTINVRIEKNKFLINHNGFWEVASSLVPYTPHTVLKKINEGKRNFPHLFVQFAKNSFYYAEKELGSFLEAIENIPPLSQLQHKNVFVVARGSGVNEDINALKDVMLQKSCSILAVDGAAQLLVEKGVFPQFIVGDMDSLPIHLFRLPVTFIAHSYLNGYSPAKEKLKEHHVDCMTIPFPGMSEDLAIMLAYISNAAHIYTLGCRVSTVELVEKGRKGMGSTILTRMYCGEKITDCKKFHQLFPTTIKREELSLLHEKRDLPFTNFLKE